MPYEEPAQPDYATPVGVGGDTSGASPTPEPQIPTAPAPAGATSGQAGPGEPANVPSWRVREETAARQQAQREAQELRAQLQEVQRQADLHRRMVGVAAGFEKPDPKAAERDEIRQQLLEIFPELKVLAERGEDLGKLVDQVPVFQEFSTLHWDRTASTMLDGLDRVVDQHFKEFGVEPSREARETINDAFARMLDRNPEAMQRYLNGDSKLVEDFWSSYRAAILDPMRRMGSVAAETRGAARAALPSAPRGATAPVPPSAPQMPADEDELHGAAASEAFRRATSRGR